MCDLERLNLGANIVVFIARFRARPGVSDKYVSVSVHTGHVRDHVQVEESVGRWPSIGGYLLVVFGQYIEGPGPVQEQFDFEDLRVGIGIARLGGLASGGRRQLHPDPAIFDVNRSFPQGIRYGGVLTLDLEVVQHILYAFEEDWASSILEMVAVRALVAASVRIIIENRQRKVRQRNRRFMST